jgi:NADP-dependent 3-hydroxy acid dehydrogenase YdfG
MKTAVITGATSGIGRATAHLLAQNNFRLIVCGRREERLTELVKDLSTHTEAMSLCFDVRDNEQVMKLFSELESPWSQIDILINNAGNAHGLAPFDKSELADWEAMIDINVKGLLYVSRVILPGMIERHNGHIINIGSVAGKEVYPNGHVYCASKSAVDAITQGMRLDLVKHNIRISGVNPGLVQTEFSLVRFKGDEKRAKDVYQGIKPLVAEDIAEILLFMVTRPPHVNIADLLVFPTAQASGTIVHRDS